ncbi:MAG: PorV/PorQ family protein [Phaeodactylibacter sp.]|nr:PorV/PorQ family protein [Phaeodactylibacter sp.]MCB9299493.1 PorV/PorQ family protein [Lewinellaceae bacterium]HQU58983.1 PorV/PorQ family protein [Saprospiraceae bacterium]
MNKLLYLILTFALVWAVREPSMAGNPDRQGESGAGQLLLNAFPRSAGLHSMSTSMASGVESMRINIAGLSRINKTEVLLGHAIYLQGTDIGINALGVAQRVGEHGAFGISLTSISFGDIAVTTTDQPEGTGTNFSPSFFNLAFGYSHTFENKVSVGVLFRGISESIQDINSFGFGIDAGVQYVTGPQDNFKFGISLRNIGSRMQYGGQGLSTSGPAPNSGGYNLTYNQRSADFELPSTLDIGLSYDFLIGDIHRLTVLGNFTSNSFSQDQLGGGVEYSLKDMFMLRGGYRYDLGTETEVEAPIYTGLSAGASVTVPLSKENKNVRFSIDYAYRATKVWDGTHNIGIRFNI